MAKSGPVTGHRKAATILFLAGLSLLLGIAVFQTSVPGVEPGIEGTVVINEVCSRNKSLLRDSNWLFSDYIELYNASEREVSIEGWHLSDDEHLMRKCRLEGVLAPGECRIIYADGEGEAPDAVAFKLRSEGETLFLTDAGGNLIDHLMVPALEADTVYARVQDGGGRWAKMEPSPGVSNAGSAVLRNRTLDAPVFSRESGFYDDPFWLELSAKENETIYYTTDGSEPTESSNVYTGKILIEEASSRPNVFNSIRNVVENWKEYTPSEKPVDKAVIIRAAAMDERMNISEVATATYFVGLDKYEDTEVVSLVAQPEDLFGEDGIYVTGKAYDEWYLSGGPEEEAPRANFWRRGREWEAKGNLQYFVSGREVTNEPAGLRIQGATTRRGARKRFKIYAREEYGGSDYFEYEWFGKRSHSLLLRSGFFDVLAPRLVEDRALAVQGARRAVVFLNGEYWYTTYIREKYDKYYMQEVYGVDADNVAMLKNKDCAEGEESCAEDYLEILERLTEEENPSADEAYRELDELIDMQSYIDFLCANIYLCNLDVMQDNNYMLWRTMRDDGSEYGDGKWRWMLYDMDCVEWISPENYGVEHRYEIAYFPGEETEDGWQPLKEHSFLRAMKNCELFRQRFVTTFLDMANTNFAKDQVEKQLKEFDQDLTWNDSFFAGRFDSIVSNVAEEFQLSGVLAEVCLEVSDPDGGYVKVNTCTPDLSDGRWSGRYFTDYPVELQAVAREGYRFAGWQGSSAADEEHLTLELKEGGVHVTAVFEKTEE